MRKSYKSILNFFRKIHPGEIIFTLSIIVFINAFYFTNNPGFLNSAFNPYYFAIIFFSSFYGKRHGLFTFLLVLICIIVCTIFIKTSSISEITVSLIISHLSDNSFQGNLLQFVFTGIISVLIFGEITDNRDRTITKLKYQKEEMLNHIEKRISEIKALSMVNDEYQDRILGQQNSLISLYSTMMALNSLNLESIYPNVLEAVSKFTGAAKSSLWKYERDERELELLTSSGWPEETGSQNIRIPDSEDLTGWVARNNAMFSVKMLQKYNKLREMDTKRNIITAPINIDGRVWGVINIEEMPFIKYNLYSEQLLMMISDLAAPAIGNALRFLEITKKGEIDPVTGFNSLDELFTILRDEFSRSISSKTNLAFIIVEMTNYSDLKVYYDEDDVLRILKQMSQLVMRLSKSNVMFFKYKDSSQMAMILPNMDYDGAAMFCLNLIELNSKEQYKIKNDTISPEILIGYSNLRQNHRSEDDLIQLAENLLLMQKI